MPRVTRFKGGYRIEQNRSVEWATEIYPPIYEVPNEQAFFIDVISHDVHISISIDGKSHERYRRLE